MNIFHENQVPWPTGKPRTKERKTGPFKTSMSDAAGRIEKELDMFTRPGRSWRVSTCTIYADWPTGVKGRFVVNGRVTDPAVVVTFVLDGKEFRLCADAYTSPDQNLAGIAEYIKSVRAQERNGIFTIDEMLGFSALPGKADRPWWQVFGLSPGVKDIAIVEAVYRQMARQAHPDAGGSHEQMAALNEAMEQARGELK